MTKPLLKLMAKDDQDLQVLAAVLQDAIVPVSEIAFKEAEKAFVLVVQRFRWDCVASDGGVALPTQEGAACTFERINCALEVLGVESVQYSGFDPNAAGQMLELLTIAVGQGVMTFIFAADAKIRLKLGDWTLKMHDFGESWPTKHCPSHPT